MKTNTLYNFTILNKYAAQTKMGMTQSEDTSTALSKPGMTQLSSRHDFLAFSVSKTSHFPKPNQTPFRSRCYGDSGHMKTTK